MSNGPSSLRGLVSRAPGRANGGPKSCPTIALAHLAGVLSLSSLATTSFAVTSLVSTTASATPNQSAAARALFNRARGLLAKGEYARACPLLEDSLQLERGIGTQFNLAHCWEHIGKLASAWALFAEVASSAKAQNQPEREAVARARADALEPRLSYIVLEVNDRVPGMTIDLDGMPVASASWGVPFPVDIGQYDLVVNAPGAETYRSRVSVWVEGKTVRVAVPGLGSPVSDEDATGSSLEATARLSEPDGESRSETPTWAYWVAGGAGVIGVAGVVLGVTASIRTSDAEAYGDQVCRKRDSEGCTVEQLRAYDHYYDQQKQWNQRAQLSYGVAAAGILSGLTVLWLAGESPSEERGPELSFDWLPGGGSARLSGSF